MDWQQEQKRKDMAAKAAKEGMQGAATAGYADSPALAHETMTQRIRSQRNRTVEQARKREQLEELIYLLDKNPEVARILDLVEAVGAVGTY